MKTLPSRIFTVLLVVSLSFSSLLVLNVKANIFPEKSSHAIYIQVTGNITPTTDLIQRNGDINTLTSNIINQPIVIEREKLRVPIPCFVQANQFVSLSFSLS